MLGETNSKKQSVQFLLGNLLPRQECIITFAMVENIRVNAGSYSYMIPAYFLPEYKYHSNSDAKYIPNYTVRYSFKIVSEQQITDIFTPDGSTTTIISEP